MYDVERSKKGGAAKADVQTKAAGDAVGAASKTTPSPAPVASKGIATVREALVAHFRDAFVPSSLFQETFGAKSWEDVQGEVNADVAQFGLDPEGEIHRDPDGTTTYTGRVWSLYTEVTVAPGAEPTVYVEID